MKQILFISLWIGITVPLLIALIFTLFRPILEMDSTGISMILLGLTVAFGSGYTGVRLYERRIEPWMQKKRRMF